MPRVEIIRDYLAEERILRQLGKSRQVKAMINHLLKLQRKTWFDVAYRFTDLRLKRQRVDESGVYYRDKFFFRVHETTLKVGNDHPKARLIEDGSPPHIIAPRGRALLIPLETKRHPIFTKPKPSLTEIAEQIVFASWVSHPGFKGKKIVESAFRVFNQKIQGIWPEFVRWFRS